LIGKQKQKQKQSMPYLADQAQAIEVQSSLILGELSLENDIECPSFRL
jgi:hypothetical protein